MKNLKLLGIQTGEESERYTAQRMDFYGLTWTIGFEGVREISQPMKTYQGGWDQNRKIVPVRNIVDETLMNEFRVAVKPRKELEYLVLN